MWRAVVLFVFASSTLCCFAQRYNTIDKQEVPPGSQVSKGTFPSVVSLRGPGHEHLCTGSIIGPRTVLTAASCFNGPVEPTILEVCANSTDLGDGGNPDVYKAAKLLRHPSYDPLTHRADIGLVLLEKDVEYSSTVSAAAPGYDWLDLDGYEAKLVGWASGVTFGGNSRNPVFLQAASMKLMSLENCRKEYNNGEEIFGERICAKGVFGKTGCIYDSGSILIANNTAIGVMAWGLGCEMGYPDYFTRVSSYSDWIDYYLV